MLAHSAARTGQSHEINVRRTVARSTDRAPTLINQGNSVTKTNRNTFPAATLGSLPHRSNLSITYDPGFSPTPPLQSVGPNCSVNLKWSCPSCNCPVNGMDRGQYGRNGQCGIPNDASPLHGILAEISANCWLLAMGDHGGFRFMP